MPRNDTTAVSRRQRRGTGPSPEKFEIVPILRIEMNVPLLRAYRMRNPARFRQWADYIRGRLKMLMRIIEAPQAEEMDIIDRELAMTGCRLGETYVESKKDSTGQVWTRTCAEYWCQNSAGVWEPDGVQCSNWTLFTAVGMQIVEQPNHFHSDGGNGHEQFDPPSRNRGSRNGRG